MESDRRLLQMKVSNQLEFGKDKIAVVHMVVGWPSKTWHPAKWNAVIDGLTENGFKVVVIGRGADIKPKAGILSLIDQLSIHEVKELISKASVMVGMDSGPLHIAMTTDCPVVGMFTIADPNNRVSKREAKTTALVPTVECRFCLHQQPPPVNFVACKFGTNKCLDDFNVDAVVQAVKETAR